MLWVCLSWEPAHAAWHPLVEAAARPLPTLAGPSARLACVRSAGPLPLALVPALQLAKDLLYRLYGVSLAVLVARRTVLDAAQQRGDHSWTVFGVGPGAGRAHRQSVGSTWGRPTAQASSLTPAGCAALAPGGGVPAHLVTVGGGPVVAPGPGPSHVRGIGLGF